MYIFSVLKAGGVRASGVRASGVRASHSALNIRILYVIQTSVAMFMRSANFWGITQRRVVILY
jgi:hypothetical protein